MVVVWTFRHLAFVGRLGRAPATLHTWQQQLQHIIPFMSFSCFAFLHTPCYVSVLVQAFLLSCLLHFPFAIHCVLLLPLILLLLTSTTVLFFLSATLCPAFSFSSQLLLPTSARAAFHTTMLHSPSFRSPGSPCHGFPTCLCRFHTHRTHLLAPCLCPYTHALTHACLLPSLPGTLHCGTTPAFATYPAPSPLCLAAPALHTPPYHPPPPRTYTALPFTRTHTLQLHCLHTPPACLLPQPVIHSSSPSLSALYFCARLDNSLGMA